MRIRSLTVVAVSFCVAAAPVLAQKDKKSAEPKRPRIMADADTNDARAYYAFGNRKEVPWDKTYDAWYWAHRLSPDNPRYRLAMYEAYQSRQSSEWWWLYLDGAEFVVKSKEAKRLDSLFYEVMVRDPFIHIPRATGRCQVPDWIQEVGDVRMEGQLYFNFGCFNTAVAKLDTALAKRPKLLGLRETRANAFYALGRYAEAVAELQKIIDELRAREQKQLVHVYQTKAMYEYMIGMIHRQAQNEEAAREAFGRSLAEDLSFFPGHQRLAELAVMRGDSAAAVAEYEQAVQLREDDGGLRLGYGQVLMSAQRYADAEAQFRRLVALEPHFALGYWALAESLDRQKKAAEAAETYTAFLARAPRREAEMIATAAERVAALKAAPAPND
jgi:tetratricopeptide (TPR) repeat protein